jgi:hypothetical protein
VANWHEDGWLIARLQQPSGQAALLVVTFLLLPARHRLATVVALGLAFVAPARRFQILALGALWLLFQRMPRAVEAAGPIAIAIGVGTVLLLLAFCLALARRYRQLPAVVQRYPIGSLHVLLLGVAAVCGYGVSVGLGRGVAGASIATLAAIIPFLLWRASYLMLSGRRGTVAATGFSEHLAYWIPLWGGSPTPYGKGWDYLKQQQVITSDDLAKCRAAGLKLLVLAAIFGLVVRGFAALHSTAGLTIPGPLGGRSASLPDLAQAIALGTGTIGLGRSWLITLLELFRSVFELAASGHLIIGVLRLFGFRVFRNTYKPLLAPTIVEFWNRYYYYFKELMVEFFFYPTFLALAKRPQATRIVVAVLAAATVGNLYFHLVVDFRRFFGAGYLATVDRVGGRLIYSVLLGIGVAVSMLRERRRRGASSAGSPTPAFLRMRAIAGVWLFYALLHVWNVGRHTLDIEQRYRFLLGLFGL